MKYFLVIKKIDCENCFFRCACSPNAIQTRAIVCCSTLHLDSPQSRYFCGRVSQRRIVEFGCVCILRFYTLFCMHPRVIKFHTPQGSSIPPTPSFLPSHLTASFFSIKTQMKAQDRTTPETLHPKVRPSNSAHCSALNKQLLCLLVKHYTPSTAYPYFHMPRIRAFLSKMQDTQLRPRMIMNSDCTCHLVLLLACSRNAALFVAV